LVQELFYLEKTEREVSAAMNLSKTTLHYHKKKVLEKLKKHLEK